MIKCDGAAYFMSAEFKGLLASRHTLIKTISVGRSNANRVERQNRTIRAFLDRRGLEWSSPQTIYDLNLYLNCTVNMHTSKYYGRVTPYELQNGFIPDTERFIKCAKPVTDRLPVQTQVNFSTFSAEMNQYKLPDISPANSNRYKVGSKCHYRKGGRKSSELAPATIETVGFETCTLRTPHNQLITRHLTDIICSSSGKNVNSSIF